MPQLTPQQIELIEQIKHGTAIECDINDVELLLRICKESSNKVPEDIDFKYYFFDDEWLYTMFQLPNAIPLSSFKPKAVEVDDRRINKAIAYINGGLDSIELNDIDEIYGKSQVLDMLNDLKNILQPK